MCINHIFDLIQVRNFSITLLCANKRKPFWQPDSVWNHGATKERIDCEPVNTVTRVLFRKYINSNGEVYVKVEPDTNCFIKVSSFSDSKTKD